MTFCTATLEKSTATRHRPQMRRGACPSLAAPMATGDGLLVRLRPARPGFAIGELIAIADAAALCGNGILEVTARGNLQIRGLTPETVPVLAGKIADAGIEIANGLAIETPPLAGYDPAEIADPRLLANQLRAAVQAHFPPLALAPKLSVIIDGGGRIRLGAVTADIRLRALRNGESVLWSLAIAGTERTAARLAVMEESAVIPAVMQILERLASMGDAARARDLDAGPWRSRVAPEAPVESVTPVVSASNPVGVHDLGQNRIVLGAGLAFGQIEARNLKSFLEAMDSLGATDVRLAPDHALMVMGISFDKIAAGHALAIGHGLRAVADDPRNQIAACAGVGACASAGIDTRTVAKLLVDAAPSLLDGSLTVHVAGCTKGCAKPSASALTITAAPIGYGLVVNGPACAEPNAYIEENNIRTAVERLDSLVHEGRRAGESARSCLTRLGADAIGAAVQQG